MGFERIDRIARDMQAGGSPGPRKRRSARSTSWRLGSIALLGVAGITGAVYFVVGGSPKPLTPKPSPMANPSPNASPEAEAPPAPAPISLAHGTDGSLRAAQIAAALEEFDTGLHSVRLSWPGVVGSIGWKWPAWLKVEDIERELGALDQQLVGDSDTLSVRTRAWIAEVRVAAPRLKALADTWGKPGASIDEITVEARAIFERLTLASVAVHAAVTAELRAPLPGSLAALGYRCRVGPVVARLPLRGKAARAGVAAERNGDSPVVVAPSAEVPSAELRTVATACLDETRAFFAAQSIDQLDHRDVYQLRMASSLSISLIAEIEQRAHFGDADRVFITSAGNMAQTAAYLARERRQLDPTLRQAEAAPSPPP